MSHGDQIDCIFFTDFRDQVWQVCSTLQHQVYRKSHVLHFWIQCVFNERFQINGTGLDWNIYFFKDYSMIFMRNTIALAHESWAWFFLGPQSSKYLCLKTFRLPIRIRVWHRLSLERVQLCAIFFWMSLPRSMILFGPMAEVLCRFAVSCPRSNRSPLWLFDDTTQPTDSPSLALVYAPWLTLHN